MTLSNPNNSGFAGAGLFLSVRAADHEVHIRADLFYPYRVTSRWVGCSRNNWRIPMLAQSGADVVGDHPSLMLCV
ncbi:hypothetical protein GCM10007363_24660 [Pseudomonas fluvialis]|uniref:Uncharacterized protein n=1 Tax=Pseudomonas fluvialis TaxID=1793966 RepID=A0ABQ2AQE9_9PSED|nr:hypothetical protein GCM10007363_24660 [Pseudomonas fluvialis]